MNLNFSSQHLEQNNPFYFMFNHEMKIIQFGKSLKKLIPSISIGTSIKELFIIIRPKIIYDFENIRNTDQTLFILKSKSSDFQMKGELLYFQDNDCILFLGSPAVTKLEEIDALDISINDFSVHDPMVDYLFLLQAVNQSIAESKKFADKLSARKEEELAKARLAEKMAVDLAARKAKFLDMAAHELRTPITVISMILQVAEKQTTKGRPLSIDVLARIQAPVKRLTSLTIDLLEMSRLDRGLLVLAPVQADLVSLVSTSIEEFRLLAPERSFLFNKSVQPIEINIDPARINQVLSNLLDNAVKYTNEGAIEITIEVVPNVIRVSVRDHGPGIPEEQQSAIFHAFSRGSSDTVTRTSGLGLGLSICHGIITLHGGTIGFVSEEGNGTTFYFELPKKEIKT